MPQLATVPVRFHGRLPWGWGTVLVLLISSVLNSHRPLRRRSVVVKAWLQSLVVSSCIGNVCALKRTVPVDTAVQNTSTKRLPIPRCEMHRQKNVGVHIAPRPRAGRCRHLGFSASTRRSLSLPWLRRCKKFFGFLSNGCSQCLDFAPNLIGSGPLHLSGPSSGRGPTRRTATTDHRSKTVYRIIVGFFEFDSRGPRGSNAQTPIIIR
jgi:hypothetical protein